MAALSVIIPAFNEEALIGQTLVALQEALAASGIDDAQIIVSDDASSDRTAEIAKQHGATVLHTKNRQIAATRNAGASVAVSDRLLFLDADTILPAETLASAIRQFNDGAVGCGVSINFDQPQGVLVRVVAAAILIPMRMLGWAAGCCIFVTREAFDAVGGFPEEYYASEELWFSQSLKQQGRFVLLSEPAVTSMRKVNTHGTATMLWTLVNIAFRGRAALKSRDRLDWWYDGNR